jgi:hypothetical protein
MDINGLRLPDFIIGGAPRTATTWLYELADRHPAICMARPVKPEPKFFLIEELHARGLCHYAQTWFASLPANRCFGEKSTNYLESPVAAQRMRDAIPDVKLIFLLRNPIDRAYSNYLWTRLNGLEVEDFGRALVLEEHREALLPEHLRYARPYAYFSRGLYAQHLARFFRLFPRQQIMIIRSEDIATRPREVAAAFHEFLGVPPRPDDANALGLINSAVDRDTPPLPAAVRAELHRRYAEPNRQLAALLGPDFPLWDE